MSGHRRTTPKQEIAQLRAEERDLACRLEVLRLQAYDHKQRGISSKNSKVLPFWKKIASRQYQTRLDSERENRRLRSLVKMHVGKAKRLTIAWKKQMTAEGYKEHHPITSQLSDEVAPPDTPIVMEQLKNEADEVYAALDAFCVGIRQQHRSRVPFLEHSEAYSVPFTRQTVDRVIWHKLESRFHGNQQQMSSTDDTITCCARRSLQLPGMSLALRIRYAARKFHEADRAVIISRTFIQPLHMNIPAQVGFRETQVYIVTSSESLVETREGNALALVDTHTSVTGDGPDRGTGAGMRDWMTSSDAADVRGVWMTALQLRKTGIEDLLFEESRTQR
ncbi:hypothetical protein P3T76_010501 [Phytophthora citrophthora]|uniref:M96 mating-specific protein family n=1 Tax=Phytophthora citrophthora TaxID=4793 RepID=A0AAD9GCG5_9STRA|nr:hypothetical protein P3T76_010501 [Phytophthora citrophthora]